MQIKRMLLLFIPFLLLSSTSAIPLKDFYPYGSTYGDTAVDRILDGSSGRVSLPARFRFFGRYFMEIFVSLYGCMSYVYMYVHMQQLLALTEHQLLPFTLKLTPLIPTLMNSTEVQNTRRNSYAGLTFNSSCAHTLCVYILRMRVRVPRCPE